MLKSKAAIQRRKHYPSPLQVEAKTICKALDRKNDFVSSIRIETLHQVFLISTDTKKDSNKIENRGFRINVNLWKRATVIIMTDLQGMKD